MSNLVKISTKAPQPYMFSTIAPEFEALKERVVSECGVDFLAKCGDVFRDATFVSSKDGVANRSNHKTGRAFDYDQSSHSLVLVKEPIQFKMYFHTYLKCEKQDSSQGQHISVIDMRGYKYTGYALDFTILASQYGFVRIPAWSGWEDHYNRMEFWHYQDMTNGSRTLTWDEAMLALKDKTRPAKDKVYGLNDRGEEVETIQQRLATLGYLPTYEVDGVFGAKTKVAIMTFQKHNNIDVDGLAGPNTRNLLFKGV